jgi:hypothetical protein
VKVIEDNAAKEKPKVKFFWENWPNRISREKWKLDTRYASGTAEKHEETLVNGFAINAVNKL